MSEPAKPNYRYDFSLLEDNVTEAYNELVLNDCPDTRKNLFLRIKELSYAIVSVGKYDKEGLDYDYVAHEYSTYLFERLIKKTFIPKYTSRFPWNNYIKKNIKYIIYNIKSEISYSDIVSDFEEILNDLDNLPDELKNTPLQVSDAYKDRLGSRLMDGLYLFYSGDEIRRLYRLSSDIIYNTKQLIRFDLPEDVYEFSITLISIAKRISRESNIKFFPSDVKISTFKKAVDTSINSTLFLAAISNAKFFSKELLLALDIDSLYRLVSIAGGKNIKIPTFTELDTLLGCTVAASEMILNGEDLNNSISKAKSNNSLVFSNKINQEYFVSKLIETFNITKDNPSSDPIIKLLVKAINSVDTITSVIENRNNGNGDEFLLGYYKELMTSLNKLTDFMLRAAAICKENENKENSSEENINEDKLSA